MELLIDRQVLAAALFSGPFMMAALLSGRLDKVDICKYVAALRRAQRDIDVRPELYTRDYAEQFPPRFRETIATRLRRTHRV